MREYSDAHLVTLARADDAQAFRLLIERYQPMMFYLALHSVGEEETAHELLQEAFLQVFLSLDSLRDTARFKQWLYGIVLNLCRNWRRMHPDKELSLEAHVRSFDRSLNSSPTDDPQEIAEEHEFRQLVRDAVSMLSPKNQIVAYLFYFEDMSVPEIASRLNISLTAVKNRLHKGRQQFQEHFQILYPEIGHVTSDRRKKRMMLPLKLVNIYQQQKHFYSSITLLLLDEKRQRIWTPQIEDDRRPQGPQEMTHVVPDTTDFLVDMIHRLRGKVEEVAIDVLYDDLLYAKVRLSSQHGRYTIKARLNDAFHLVVHERCPVVVAEAILEQQATALIEYGDTQEQQFTTLKQIAEQSPNRLQVRFAKQPNLDFSTGLRHWTLFAPLSHASYTIDPDQGQRGKVSLALTLSDELFPHVVLLSHNNFSASPFRGKRLRARTYLKADGMLQPIFRLQVSGPSTMDNMLSENNDQNVSHYTSTEMLPGVDTSQWIAHELVIDVPEQAQSISLTFTMRGRGKGTFWLDAIQLEIVEQSLPLTGTLPGSLPRKPVNQAFSRGLLFWAIAGIAPWFYEQGVEQEAAYIKALDTASAASSCTLQQLISAEQYWGKHVHFSAQVKSVAVESQASLFVNQLIGTYGMRETIKGTTMWTALNLTLTVPEGISVLSFGITLHGTGQVWLKDVQLEVTEDIPS